MTICEFFADTGLAANVLRKPTTANTKNRTDPATAAALFVFMESLVLLIIAALFYIYSRKKN